jgi:hypothetical protein
MIVHTGGLKEKTDRTALNKAVRWRILPGEDCESGWPIGVRMVSIHPYTAVVALLSGKTRPELFERFRSCP